MATSVSPAKGNSRPLVLPCIKKSLPVFRDGRAAPESLDDADIPADTPAPPLENKEKTRRPALTIKDANLKSTVGAFARLKSGKKTRSILQPLPTGISKVKPRHVGYPRNSSPSAQRKAKPLQTISRAIDIDGSHTLAARKVDKAGHRPGGHTAKSKRPKPRKPDHPLAEALKEAEATYRSQVSETLSGSQKKLHASNTAALTSALNASNDALNTYSLRATHLTSPPTDPDTNEPLATSFAEFEKALASKWEEYDRVRQNYDEIHAQLVYLILPSPTNSDPTHTRALNHSPVRAAEGENVAQETQTTQPHSYTSAVTTLSQEYAIARAAIITRLEKELDALATQVEKGEAAFERNQRVKRRKTDEVLRMMIGEDSGDEAELEAEGGNGNQNENEGHDRFTALDDQDNVEVVDIQERRITRAHGRAKEAEEHQNEAEGNGEGVDENDSNDWDSMWNGSARAKTPRRSGGGRSRLVTYGSARGKRRAGGRVSLL